MKLNRILSVLTLVTAAVFAPMTATAGGIPVIDIAAIYQAILQVNQQILQVENQIRQLEQMALAAKAMNGTRNLGRILDNPALRNYVPPEAADTVAAIERLGSSGLSASARSLRTARMTYDCEDRVGTDKTYCQSGLAQPYQQLAFMQDAMRASRGRQSQISDLMTQIDRTMDPKAIAEVQARLAAENAMLQHVQSQVTMSYGMAAAQQEVDRVRAEEARMQQASRTGKLSDFLPGGIH